ncbi:MAG: hypothetical protein RLZZ323_547 [Bacteroidota bacterium]|jgi:hypothetical protein
MGMEKFQNKYILFLVVFFFVSCMSKKEKALSDAYAEFNYQVNDLRLDVKKFKGPVKLKKDDRNFYPRKNHVLYGWNSIMKKKTVWIYVEVDTTFEKDPSVSYSNNW